MHSGIMHELWNQLVYSQEAVWLSVNSYKWLWWLVKREKSRKQLWSTELSLWNWFHSLSLLVKEDLLLFQISEKQWESFVVVTMVWAPQNILPVRNLGNMNYHSHPLRVACNHLRTYCIRTCVKQSNCEHIICKLFETLFEVWYFH